MAERDLCQLDKYDLVNIIDAINDHVFLLRHAFSLIGEGSCWMQDRGKEENQALILIDMYLKHVDDIIEKGVY